MSRTPTPRSFSANRLLSVAIVAAILAAAFLALLPARAEAAPLPPWFGPGVKATQSPAYTSYSPSLAVGSDGTVYLAFAGSGGSTTQADIFFTKSVDGGRTWIAPVKVNNDAGGAQQSDPSLALDHNDFIYIVWTDPRGGNNDVYFSKSTDGGLSFSSNVRVNDVTTSFQMDADVVVDPTDPNLIHVVWMDERNQFTTWEDIYYANSTDGGLSFNPNRRVNNDATGAEQGSPAVAVASDRSVYVVWSDPRNGARGSDIYFSKSMDLGNSWTPNSIVNDDTGNAAQSVPTIAVDSAGAIYVAWQDNRMTNTAPDIFATRSTNGGSSFAASVKVNDDNLAVFQGQPSLAANAGKVQVAWTDTRTQGSTSWDIYTASSADGLTWSANMKANDDSLLNFQQTPTIGLDSMGDVFAAFFDQRASGQDVYANVLDVVAPSASAGVSGPAGQGVPISFDGGASSDNLGIASYAWDFGDGSSGNGMATSHAYSVPGTYTATLTVTDYSGNSGTATVQVIVRDTEAPVALGGGDRTVDEGQPLFFDASASTDNAGIVSYAWDFGDGDSSTDAAVSHVYARPGSYDASLTVTDAAGNSDTVTMTITVRVVSPKASELLGMIQVLQLLVILLALVVGVLTYMLLGMRRRGQAPQSMPPPAQAPPPASMPSPPKDADPLDMPLTDEPKGP